MGGRDFLMKRYKTANRIFLASAILFGIAIGVHCFCENPLTGLFYFLAQSCLIGCFADWFAVEALFRNRLHLPLFKPLIPANREAVLRRLQETVEGKLVGKETFTDLLKNFSLIQFIEKEAEGSVKDIETDLARSGGELLLGFMENHKKDLSRWIRQGVDNVRVSLGFYLREKALEGNYTEQFLDKLLEEAQRAVKSDQMKQIITNKLEKLGENRERGFLERLVYSFAKFTNTVDYEDMAEAFLAALSERIELWRVDIHPFHKTLLKEWNAAVEAFLKTEEAEKALVHFAEELYQSVSVEEKTDALYNSLYEKWAAGDQFEKRFVNEYYAERNFSFSGDAQAMQDRVISIVTQAQMDNMYEHGGTFGCGEYIHAGEPLAMLWDQLKYAKIAYFLKKKFSPKSSRGELRPLNVASCSVY